MKLNLEILNNEKFRKIVKIIGNLLCGASIIFIAVYFIRAKIDFSAILNPAILSEIIILGLFVSFSVAANGLAWKKNLEMFALKDAKAIEILYIYSRANLAKYIPGNVMHYISRNILGSDIGLNQKEMGFSSVLEVILQMLIAFLFVLCLVSSALFNSIKIIIENGQISLGFFIAIIIVILAIIIFAVIYLFKNRRKMKLQPKKLFYSCSCYALFCIINSIAFSFVILFMQSGTNSFNIITLSGYYMLAWFLGFITPGAPSGLGIREYILVLLFTTVYPNQTVLFLMVVMRIITVLADVFAFIIVLFIRKKSAGHNILKYT